MDCLKPCPFWVSFGRLVGYCFVDHRALGGSRPTANNLIFFSKDYSWPDSVHDGIADASEFDSLCFVYARRFVVTMFILMFVFILQFY